ncbi:MAG: DUF2070 family protein [Metallosphaera yellowstonensis]
MDSEKLTRSYYSKLIRLPSTQNLVLWVSGESFLAILRSFSDGLSYILGFVIYAGLSLLAFRKRIRTSLFLTGLFGILYLLLSFFPATLPYSFGLFSPLVAYTLVIDYGEKASTVISVFTGLIPGYTLVGLSLDIPLLVFYLLVGAFSFVYFDFINRQGTKITGFPSLNIVRPFLKAFSYRREDELEAFLERISTGFQTSVLSLKLGEVVLLVPRIHYGMYGRVGSSGFIYQLEDLLKDKILVFHGPGSHELDIPSSRESMKVAQAIASGLNDGWTPLKFQGLRILNESQFVFTSLIFDKISLSFAERPGKGIDDLPGTLWDESLITGNFIVDCHNESLKEEIGHKDEIVLKSFLSKKLILDEKELQVGYGETRIGANCEGVCDNRVKALVIGDGAKRILVLYVYANNADEETSRKARELFKDKFDRVILVTPDDHSCTASVWGNLYSPARPCNAMLEAFKEATEMALSNIKKVEASYKIMTIKTKIIGKFVSVMVQGLEQVGNTAMKTFWIPIIFPYFLLFLILLGHGLFKI